MEAQQLVGIDKVTAAVGVSKPTIWRWAAQGKFPRPAKCGAASRWPWSEVQAWIDARVAERDAGAV